MPAILLAAPPAPPAFFVRLHGRAADSAGFPRVRRGGSALRRCHCRPVERALRLRPREPSADKKAGAATERRRLLRAGTRRESRACRYASAFSTISRTSRDFAPAA